IRTVSTDGARHAKAAKMESEARGAKQGGSTVRFVAVGAAVGVVFPLVAALIVEPKSTLAGALFWALCIAAGVGVGLISSRLMDGVAERSLAGVLQHTSKTLGIPLPEVHGLDEASREIGRAFDQIASRLRRIQMVGESVQLANAEIASATEEQASGAAQQAAAVTETSATVEELAQTSSQIADNAAAVVRIAEKTLASAEEGMNAVASTAMGIEEIRETTMQSSDRILALGERSQEIGRVLSIIDEIAEQTKILALNAAIEAARAGEAGKGFSVVAEEIRKLADSVTESTQEIGRVVREIQASTSALIMQTEKAAKKVAEGQELAAHTAVALERIVVQVEQTTDSAKQISIATQQQRTASDQVVLSMREVALVSQHAAEASRRISAAIGELGRLSDEISTHR
ncbi:MAG: methyl-accepting chemotaxis protein, partial [Coriobacteriia bacterium]